MEIGICIQAGLCNDAEYFYLTDPGWKEEIARQCSYDSHWHPHQKIIDSIDSWEYYGIEQSVGSVTAMANKFGDAGHWLGARLIGSSKLPYRSIRYKREVAPYVPNVTLDDVINGFRLERIDLLALDIENDEYSVLSNYDWHIRPATLSCEVHSYYDYEKLLASPDGVEISVNPADTLERNCGLLETLLKDCGYSLYFKKCVNPWHEDFPTKELKFIG